MGRFDGKIALVTGASSGIGASSALRLAAEGARVYGLGRNGEGLAATQAAIASAGGDCAMATCDVSDPGACREAVSACVAHYGQLDILVNCAGQHVFRPLQSITDDTWLQDLATNLGGTFYLSQAAVPHLLESAGNIVNVGSLASVEGQTYSATYCSAKHGVVGLTKALAVEFAKTDLRVNAVCPGGTDTPQIAKVGIPDEADFDLVMRSAGLRGMSEPEDIAAVIAFLASDDARAVNGAIYMADQGKTAG